VPANEAEAKESASNDKISNNMCARVLTQLLHAEKDPDLRRHAILGIGLTGDPKAGQSLLGIYRELPPEIQPDALIALGLARLPDAIPLLVELLPKSARNDAEPELAAIHALGLYGREFVEEIEKAKRGKETGIEILEDLASSRSAKDPTKAQAITSLARLGAGIKDVTHAVKERSVAVKNAAILVLPEYSTDEKDAATAWKALKSGYKGSQQTKSFVILATGDLAGRLDENSKTREQALKWLHDKKQLGSNDNYTRACSALALGVAGDQTAAPAIADMLQNTTIDHYVAGACSVALGLLKQAAMADIVVSRVVKGKFNADAKGYGLIGLALMGDTTRVDLVLDAAKKEQQKETARQAPLAIGVLGDRRQTRTLTEYFSNSWKQKDRYPVSNAAFGQGWIRDAESVDGLLKLASTSPDAGVRAMAAIALGYVGATDPVNGLTRCFAGTNYKKDFVGFQTLFHISTIL
jgi:HEAT repeat protein